MRHFLISIISLIVCFPSMSFAAFQICGGTNTLVTYQKDINNSTDFILYLHPGDFPVNHVRTTALLAARDKLNSSAHNKAYAIQYASTAWANDSRSYRSNNAWSEGYLTTDSQFPMSAPWIVNYATCNQYVSDLQISTTSGNNWSNSSVATDLISYGGSTRPYQATYLHEMGHQLGLRHENTKYNIMGTDFTHIHRDGDTATAYIGSDAAKLLMDAYGAKTQQDLSISHWKYDTANGEYSKHIRNGIYRPAGQWYNLYTYLDPNQPGEIVWWGFKRGETIGYETTIENSGNMNWYARVGYYLSTDKTLSTNDIFLGYISNVLINRGDPLLYNANLTMPTNVASGYYSIIAKIDDDNGLDEVNESNNASYTQIYLSQ